MSKIIEAFIEKYHEDFDYTCEDIQQEEKEQIDYLSEKEKCKLYGISCSYGICDECDIAERS